MSGLNEQTADPYRTAPESQDKVYCLECKHCRPGYYFGELSKKSGGDYDYACRASESLVKSGYYTENAIEKVWVPPKYQLHRCKEVNVNNDCSLFGKKEEKPRKKRNFQQYKPHIILFLILAFWYTLMFFLLKP